MKKYIIWMVLLGLAVLAFVLFKPKKNTEQIQLTDVVKRGDFQVNVTATGELQARNSVKIMGPQGMRSANIWNTTIQDIIDEGSYVHAGDYVAQLDRTELVNKMTERSAELDQIEQQLIQAQLDTALELRQLRDQMVNLRFSMREKELEMEQSIYEPPAIIGRLRLELERIERDYRQQVRNYELKQQLANAKIAEIESRKQQKVNGIKILQDLGDEFKVVAPADGMLTYYYGQKKGSTVGAWNPIVAELPDLSDMLSITYVNEVDISKLSKGQKANVKIDAFPGKTYTGTIIKVANVGQQLPGYDAKVFEVNIQLDKSDSIMRPAMTTANDILTAEYKDVLYIPLESVFNDSVTFSVVKKDGKTYKQQILTGPSNANAIIVEHGLEEGVTVLLSLPDKHEKLPFQYLDKKVVEDYTRKRKEAEMAQRAKAEEARKALEAAADKMSNEEE
jgi:hypothetical protein